jgi:hypothetical protein
MSSSRVNDDDFMENESELNLEFLESNLLVRAAGESLASSAPVSTGKRCKQCALGLRKFAPKLEFACKPKATILWGFPKTPGSSGSILTNLPGVEV